VNSESKYSENTTDWVHPWMGYLLYYALQSRYHIILSTLSL